MVYVGEQYFLGKAHVSESDVVSRARQGDEAAYELLVREHQEAVFRLAYLLLGDPGDAEDVAQETFIRAFKALDRFDASRPMRPWLLRIAANLARNQRRSIGRHLAALQRFVRAEPPTGGSAANIRAETEDLRKEEAQELWQAIRRLDRTDQEIIYLRYFLELSSAETAEALDIAPGTVKSRLHRALSRLRTVVENEFTTLWEGGSGD
jgi:RNA polymerase sigma-70 factor (ECF subfamily)